MDKWKTFTSNDSKQIQYKIVGNVLEIKKGETDFVNKEKIFRLDHVSMAEVIKNVRKWKPDWEFIQAEQPLKRDEYLRFLAMAKEEIEGTA